MGVPRTLGLVTSVKGTPTPIFTGAVIAAVSFSIFQGVGTIVLGANNLPANGYNGPNNAIQGNYPAPNGQQITLFGFTTATYFNGKVVTSIGTNPTTGAFSFYFNHANVASTNDAGNTAACPVEHYRVAHIECGPNLGTDAIYVGDLNVSSTRYLTKLSLAGLVSIDIASDNLPADRIFIDTNGTGSGDACMVSLLY